MIIIKINDLKYCASDTHKLQIKKKLFNIFSLRIHIHEDMLKITLFKFEKPKVSFQYNP